MSTPSRYQPGDQPIPGHTLTAPLDADAFGERWRAHDDRLARAETLRLVERSLPIRESDTTALHRMTAVRHDHLLPVFDVQPVDGTPADADRATLVVVFGPFDRPLTGPLPPADAVRAVTGVAAALDALFAKCQCVHGHVRPDSLVLVGGRVVLADVGLSILARPDPRLVRQPGPEIHYAAPEQWREAPGPRTDQYALAVTYYELRTGRRPMPAGLPAVEVAVRHADGRLDFDGVSAAERAVLQRATAGHPDDRFPSCAAFARALADALHPSGEMLALPSASPGRVARPSAPTRSKSVGGVRFDEGPADTTARRRAAPVSRRATVRYYSRMNPQRTFPLLVVLAPGEIAKVVQKHVEQATSAGFAADPDAPVEVEPVLPGCGVYPPSDRVSVAGDEPRTLTFYVVPQVLGTVLGARVAVRQNGRLLTEIPLTIKVRRTTAAWVLAGLGLLAPYLTPAAKSANLDFESQKAAGFPIVQTLLQAGTELLRPEWLGVGLLGLAAAVYLYLRPRRREVFWDVSPARAGAPAGGPPIPRPTLQAPSHPLHGSEERRDGPHQPVPQHPGEE